MPDKNFCIMRIGRLKSSTAVAHAARHNLREYNPHNVDQERTKDNVDLYSKTREQVLSKLNDRLSTVDRKIRPDAVKAVEYVITRSPESKHVNDRQYLSDALLWIEQKHGAENMLSATYHMDEDTPHLHALIVPIVEKEKNGETINSLSAKTYFSGKKVLSNLQTDFHEKVGAYHNLDRGIMRSGAKHIPLKEFYNNEKELSEKELKIPRFGKRRKEAIQGIEGMVRRNYARGLAENKTEVERNQAAAREMKQQRNKAIDHAKKLDNKIDRLENPEKYKQKDHSRDRDRGMGR